MSLTLQETLALVTVILNVGGLVWGIGKLSKATEILEEVSARQGAMLIDHETRISRMEGSG